VKNTVQNKSLTAMDKDNEVGLFYR